MTEIISRKDAKAQGLRCYFTGKPCLRGHIAERWVSVAACVVCQRDHGRAWQRAHPEIIATKNREWRTANPDYAKQWSLENAEHVRQKSRQWYRANTARRLATGKAWERVNPEAAQARSVRYRARLAQAPGSFTADDIDRILEQQGYRCAAPHCRCDILRRFDIDHIIPLSRPGTSNWPHNLQLLCHPCNTSKGDRTMEEWLQT